MMRQQNLDWHTTLRAAAETVIACHLNLDNNLALTATAPEDSLEVGQGEVRVFHAGLDRFLPVGSRNS